MWTAPAICVLVIFQFCHWIHTDVHLWLTAVGLPVVGHVAVARPAIARPAIACPAIEPIEQEAIAACRHLFAHAVRVYRSGWVVELVPAFHGCYNNTCKVMPTTVTADTRPGSNNSTTAVITVT